jgi:CoA-transferase family III
MKLVERPIALATDVCFAIIMPNPAILIIRRLLLGLGLEEIQLGSHVNNERRKILLFSAEARDSWLYEWNTGVVFCHLPQRAISKNRFSRLCQRFFNFRKPRLEINSETAAFFVSHLAASTAILAVFSLLGSDRKKHSVRVDYDDALLLAESLSQSCDFVRQNSEPYRTSKSESTGTNHRETSRAKTIQIETLVVGKESPHPMIGLRVLDIGRFISARFAARCLAEFGADVLHICIQSPGESEEKQLHYFLNCGKRTIAFDTRGGASPEFMRQAIADWKPHLIVHDFPPEAAQKLGIDPQEVRRELAEISSIHIGSCTNHILKSSISSWIQAQTGLLACALFMGERFSLENHTRSTSLSIPGELTSSFLSKGRREFEYAWQQLSREFRPDWNYDASPSRLATTRIHESQVINTAGLPLEIDGKGLRQLGDADPWLVLKATGDDV